MLVRCNGILLQHIKQHSLLCLSIVGWQCCRWQATDGQNLMSTWWYQPSRYGKIAFLQIMWWTQCAPEHQYQNKHIYLSWGTKLSNLWKSAQHLWWWREGPIGSIRLIRIQPRQSTSYTVDATRWSDILSVPCANTNTLNAANHWVKFRSILASAVYKVYSRCNGNRPSTSNWRKAKTLSAHKSSKSAFSYNNWTDFHEIWQFCSLRRCICWLCVGCPSSIMILIVCLRIWKSVVFPFICAGSIFRKFGSICADYVLDISWIQKSAVFTL